MHLSMDNETEKPQECINFQSIRDMWKKHKLHSSKRHHHVHKNNHFSSHDNKSNQAQDENFFKVSRDKKQDANNLKTLRHNGNGFELHEINHKHMYNNCFKAIIFLAAPKKKQIPSKVSASDLPNNENTQPVQQISPGARSFNKAPSIGRLGSINNSINEPSAKTPYYSREPSLSRTASVGSRSTSMKRMNGSFVSRSPSIGRSKSEEVTSSRRISTSNRSGPLIMFSTSSGMLKPPALEQQLECTLEELCHGCVKHIKVSREIYIYTGHIFQEEQVLTVNVQPGWKTGTKITFQGTTNEDRPGEYPADVIFLITEKHHHLFHRNEDDLELEIEIPLVDALTGCTLAIPLLGKEKMSVRIDDVVYPGYEKIIVGQGMPNQKKPDHRGDLKVKFLVEFPKRLRDEQRSEVFRILNG